MIKCKNCNAIFSNDKIYNIHKILCSAEINKKDNEKKSEEKKIKRTTSRKKKSGEDN